MYKTALKEQRVNSFKKNISSLFVMKIYISKNNPFRAIEMVNAINELLLPKIKSYYFTNE